MFEFVAVMEYDGQTDAGYMKHHLPLPDEVAEALNASGVTRVAGTLDGHAFRRALYPRRGGGWCLRFGEGWIHDTGLDPGQAVVVALSPDPDGVDVPDELAAALAADPDAAERWALLTPGRQRTLAYGVARSKRSETRARRAEELLRSLPR